MNDKLSRFPLTRFALARIFANLTVVCLPEREKACIEKSLLLADHLRMRAFTIAKKGQEWRVEDPEL